MADNSMMDDLIPEERHEQNQVLLQHLRGTYARDAEDAQALARMRERFLQSRTSSSLHPDYSQRGEMGQDAKPVSSRGGPSRSSRGFHGASRGPRFSTLAAVLFAALLVSSFLLLFSYAHQTGTGRVKSKNTPATGKQIEPMTYIHMFDAHTGWAVNNNTAVNHNPKRILHTTAGVTHWQDVTPPVDDQRSIIAGADFFTPSTAWVAVIEGSRLFVYGTHDGGQTWQKASIPDRIGWCWMTFLNAHVGWLLLSKGPAMNQEPVDVLHTSDGGVTWKVISVSTYSYLYVQNPTGPSIDGDKTGLSFVNETTGWITAAPIDPDVYLSITHDGGVTWQHQSIPLPEGASLGSVTLPPIFFNATDGILPLILSGPPSQALHIYVTHNGGASWSATTPVPLSATAGTWTAVANGGIVGGGVSTADSIDFVDAMHGWLASNTFAVKSHQYLTSTVYRTSDGGQHWTHSSVRLKADITMIDFVSRAQGWAIDSAQALYQTTDGGQTWTKVN
jgi:photosystem II stability/assembly factor-like uncharacterized protein